MGALAASTLIGAATPAHASDGSLDWSFGNRGQVISDFGRSETATAVAVQSDGRIVVAGTSASLTGAAELAVTRFLSDGRVDTSFGQQGHVTVDIGAGVASVASVAVQSSGRILVAVTAAGSSGSSGCYVAGLSAAGRLDASFGQSGVVRVDLGRDAAAAGLAIQSNGSVVVVGSGGGRMAVARLTSSGSLDATFGEGGRVFVQAGGETTGQAITILAGGGLIAAGEAGGIGVVARLDASGSLDASFGQNGVVTVAFAGCSGAPDFNPRAVGAHVDGRVVVAGSVTGCGGGGENVALVRLTAAGALDTSLGGDGSVQVDVRGGADAALSVQIQRDGQIVVCGPSAVGLGLTSSAILRFEEDGSLDTGFGFGGRAGSVLSTTGLASFTASEQADGRIVVAGGLLGDFFVERYENTVAPPEIAAVAVVDGRLYVEGEHFGLGARVLVNGAVQKTATDPNRPGERLMVKRARKLPAGEPVTIQVRAADGTISEGYSFTR